MYIYIYIYKFSSSPLLGFAAAEPAHCGYQRAPSGGGEPTTTTTTNNTTTNIRVAF